jgi:hypothetical protein
MTEQQFTDARQSVKDILSDSFKGKKAERNRCVAAIDGAVRQIFYVNPVKKQTEKWKEQRLSDDMDSRWPQHNTQTTCLSRCCERLCYNQFCCCLSCGSYTLNCVLWIGVFFYALSWIVAWYKPVEP